MGMKAANGQLFRQHGRIFGTRKYPANKERDRRSIAALEELGYRCLGLWQCELKNIELLKQRLCAFLGGKRRKYRG